MTIRKSSIVVLTRSMLAFSCVVLAIGNLQGEEGQDDSTTAERPGKAESEQLKKGMDARALRRLENVEVNALTDDDLRAAVKILASQIRQLTERVDRLENPTPRLHPAKSLESQKLNRLRLDLGFKKLAAIDEESQRVSREVHDLEQEVIAAQARLNGKKMQATRLQVIHDQLADELKELGKQAERD